MRAAGAPAPPEPLSDERLGSVAVSLTVSELVWVPDVAPAVMDRISRDAAAYPEQFDRRLAPPPPPPMAPEPSSERSLKRTVTRAVIIGVVLAVGIALIVFAATASAAEAAATADCILTVVTEVA